MTGSPDSFRLQRFIDAQTDMFEAAIGELRTGKKQSHWIWFVFPQLAQLGRSATSQFYGIETLDEANAYLKHPSLGGRYREAVEAIMAWAGRKTAIEILGEVDAMKFRSSLTLFEQASADPLFTRALNAFYDGPDEATMRALER